MKRKEWMVIAVFALLASTILYITMDLAMPMSGFIKPDTGQATIVNFYACFFNRLKIGMCYQQSDGVIQ